MFSLNGFHVTELEINIVTLRIETCSVYTNNYNTYFCYQKYVYFQITCCHFACCFSIFNSRTCSNHVRTSFTYFTISGVNLSFCHFEFTFVVLAVYIFLRFQIILNCVTARQYSFNELCTQLCVCVCEHSVGHWSISEH